MTTFQRTAAHESGHAVAAHVLGGHLGLTWALPDYSLHGACGEANVGHTDPDKAAIVFFAGTVATAFCAGVNYNFYPGKSCAAWTVKTKRRGRKPNRAGLVRLSTREPGNDAELEADIHAGRTSDLVAAWGVIRKDSKTDAEAVARFDAAQHAAMRIVVENLATIRALASILESERILTAEQVRAFLGKRF